MSPSTRSSPADARGTRAGPRALLRGVVLAAAFAASVAPAKQAAASAPPLPPAVIALTGDLTARGGGEMRFLGLSIYDGWYWSARAGWSLDAPFALDLHYQRKLAGARIAERSIEEIAKLGIATPEQLARWGAAMHRIFPDVRQGDRLTGLFLPPATVRYFGNGKPIGDIDDPQFARAFFGIWLDPRTSRADFRRQLLGTP